MLRADVLRFSAMACLLLAAQVNSYMLSTPAGVQLQRHAEPQMATKVSRRKEGLDTQVDREKLYEPVEALGIVKKTATAKFVETIELHGNLNLDPKYNDQQIRTTVSLPAGTGNTVRVAVLAEGPAADAATAAGADLVGMGDLIETISSGQLDFDVLLATPPAMPKLAKLGKVLGPKVSRARPCHSNLLRPTPRGRCRAHHTFEGAPLPGRGATLAFSDLAPCLRQGLMPSPKAGTVSADPGAAVAEFKVRPASPARRSMPSQSPTVEQPPLVLWS